MSRGFNFDEWHDFAKEKPSEDMEGRNFIVSNGHYEKIATWCGYWENEPFMGNKLCDEVVRWKGYLTPEEEKANEATRTELKAIKIELNNHGKPIASIQGTTSYYGISPNDTFYPQEEADVAIAELKQKLESVQASMYCDVVDANMENRKLRRALWLARAERAVSKQAYYDVLSRGISSERDEMYDVWNNVERKCLKKAEEYK